MTGSDSPLSEEYGITKPAHSHGSKHVGQPLSASWSAGPETTSIYKPAQSDGSNHVGQPLSASRSTGPEYTSIYTPAQSDGSKHGTPPVCSTRSTGPEYGRKPVTNMEVVSTTGTNVPSDWISSSGVMPDGRIIVVDWRNKQIILQDKDFTLQSALTLTRKPYDVAVYGENAAVVTMPYMKQLQYIHVDTTLQAGHIIPTVLPCLGVAVIDGEIYVGVNDDNDHGHVRFLDRHGNVIRSIMRRSGGIPCITVERDGTLYTADFNNEHITCYTSVGEVVYDVKHEGMSGPGGMVADKDDNLLVRCKYSSNIHVLGMDGVHHGVILSSADGVVRPTSVAYRRSDQLLIVTMANNSPGCRAYNLK